ncbi:hypothetical protein [Pedobacter frigiditerrae]|uniref:carboxypeptidase-like regulatory domain-containing protein n=1 Tax=Pedobacter frigiditerrae TaxID=2530452 RepID=UPI00292DD9D7|nr:hypothetical protein [Pedobacter frigiditerrae]
MKNRCTPYILLLIVFSLFVGRISAQQKKEPANTDVKTMKLFFEKTYLHTDRNYYSSGEDIWFSAYLVNGKSTSLTNTSNNLYVELIDPNAELIERKLIRMDAGLGNGDFKLKDTLQSGWYNIRAYTNWMHNFGNDFVFQKKIFITNTINDKDVKVTKKPTKKAENVNITSPKKTITFFPEGGSLVEGVNSIVAFKTNDEFGEGLKAKGSIISSKGDTITTFQSTETGMGIFAFAPVANENYKVEWSYNSEKLVTALPSILKKGFTIHLTTDSAALKASISTNEITFNELLNKQITIIIKHAGDNVYTGSVDLTKPTVSVTIPTKELPAGLASLTLLDQLGRPQCERLVYIQSANRVNFTIHPDKTIYKPKEKVSLKINATNQIGQPVKANLSLAVVDGIVPSDESNIISYLMLQSEIKGDIKNAAQYFDTQNPARFKQLDLLLLTQGWREYLWRKLADTSIKISYMPEPGITIHGSVREKLGNKPLPEMNITLFAPEFKGDKVYFTKTDAAGRYYLDGLNWYGNKAIKLSSRNNKNEKKGWLQIDSLFKPIPINIKNFSPFAVSATISDEIVKRSTYNRKYKLGDSIMLDEVKIVQKKKERVYLFDETLSTFGYPDQVFNITAADYDFKSLEHYLLTNVNGARPAPLDDSVANSGVIFPRSGRPRIIVNNRQDIQDRLDYYELTMNQITKIVIKRLINNNGDDVYVMYLDLKPEALLGPNLDILNINLNGYYTAKTFYSPNYTSNNSSTFRDLRTTVFWAPLLKTNEKGEATVSFHNSDNKSSLVIKVDGITEKGEAITSKSSYKVQ